MQKTYSFISWNVNGIRAWQKKGHVEWFLNQKPDFFMLQETKAHPDQLDEELKNHEGYFSFFNYSKVKKGYSGTAIYTKHKPEKVEYSFDDGKSDEEGRLVILYYKKFVVIDCYFPNGGGGPVRLEYKLQFYKRFLAYCLRLEKEGYEVIFGGDVNTAHTEIDLARPKENVDNTGFLPIERAWIDDVVSAGYIDTFRYLNPNKTDSYTYWDMKTRARDRNVGWRIDYFFVSKNLKKNITETLILDETLGSDHCPIALKINLEI